MKFSNISFRNIFAVLAVFLLTLSVSYSMPPGDFSASTNTAISKTRTNSPPTFLTISKTNIPFRGIRYDPGRLSTAPFATHTSFTGFVMPRLSATDLRSDYGSADLTRLRSISFSGSTISISAGSAEIRANHFENSLSNDISKTVPHYSAERPARNYRIFATHSAINSRTSPIGKQRPSFRPPSSEYEIGRISERLIKPDSNWREWLQRSTRGQRNYAGSWTGNSFASVLPREPSNVSISWNRANSPRSFMNPRSERLFPGNRLRQSRTF